MIGKHRHIDSLLVFLLVGIVLYFFLGDRLLHLNEHVYAFGGDAAILFYNMIYYGWYGSDLHLSHMNYPVGESLLMTDAQASVSLLLNWLDGLDFVHNHTVGFIHGFHYICLGVAAIFAQKTLYNMGVVRWMAILGGLLIVIMSPQILRVKAHYGLAYPVLFTSIIFTLVSFSKKLEVQKFEWRYLILFFGTILFFGLNNIYLLIIGGGVSFFFGVIHYLYRRDYRIIWFPGLASLAILMVFILIKMTDPGMERMIIQWGYEANKISLDGLFHPYTSLAGILISRPGAGIESACNLGLVSSMIMFVFLLSMIKKSGRKFWSSFFQKESEMKILILSSIILLIYAMGALEILAEAIPAATMFKASGRFAWPFYYAISFTGILVVYKFWNFLKDAHQSWRWLGLIPLLIWGVESYNYLDKHVKFNQHPNPYSITKLTEIKDKLTADGIDYQNYQAIYALPIMIGWNDKYHFKAPWSTEYSATRLSMATGLPMINAMLSRMGLARANEITSLAAHPLLPKSIHPDLDDRPLLLVVGQNQKLTRGEQWLKDQSTLLQTNKHHQLYHLDISQLNSTAGDTLDCDQYEDYWYYKGYNERSTVRHMHGQGSQLIEKNTVLLTVGKLSADTLYHTRYAHTELSLAVFTDNEKYGMPWITAVQYDAQGKKIKEDSYDMASAKNILGSWRIANFKFDQSSETDSLKIALFNINQDLSIDELLIRPQSDALCSFLPESGFLVNE